VGSYNIAYPEMRAKKISQQLSRYSEAHWEELYVTALQFHQARFHGEPIGVEASSVELRR